MKTGNRILHRADTRGHADHGWLKSSHTFSFSGYYDPERVHFGVLRVLNDDEVSGGRGFGMHPHDNMEIISIPLEGTLVHKDSMGNEAKIAAGEIQVMSAGTGISHTEYNADPSEKVKFLQIWLFPRERNVKPRYDQRKFDEQAAQNKFLQLLSPNPNDDNVWIHQDAWFSLANLDEGITKAYTLKKEGNGVYIFVLSGDVTVAGEQLHTRDGLGITETNEITFAAGSNARVLVMEVPMAV